MRRLLVGLVSVVAVALLAAGSTSARADTPTAQELTIAMSDGTQLACGLVLPAGAPPAGGWPGLLLFAGLGQAHSSMETLGTQTFAPAGFASLTCDERGTGGSGGAFDLAGPQDVQDVRDLFAWLASRPDISDTKIGALGFAIGGAEVWNAAVAGVPFEAIVPALTWTSLARALTPGAVLKSQLLQTLSSLYPTVKWDPALTAMRHDLLTKGITDGVVGAELARSARDRLHSLNVPTLMIQSRNDALFDLGQATAAFKLLAGPKRLYVGDPSRARTEVVDWFRGYLAGGKPPARGVELAHAPWDGTTTTFPNLPPTRHVVVNLPGPSKLAAGTTRRSVRLPGGPLETFGSGSVTIRYSGASSAWKQFAALVSLKGGSEPITQGAAPVTAAAGLVKIPLMNEAFLLPRGKRLMVRIGPREGLFTANTPPPGKRAITITRVTLSLSVLRRAVSR